MIEWLWWSSWILLAYAYGCRNGYGCGEVAGYVKCAKDEHDALCSMPHPVSGMTPCMEAKLRKGNPLLVLDTATGELRDIRGERIRRGLAGERGPC